MHVFWMHDCWMGIGWGGGKSLYIGPLVRVPLALPQNFRGFEGGPQGFCASTWWGSPIRSELKAFDSPMSFSVPDLRLLDQISTSDAIPWLPKEREAVIGMRLLDLSVQTFCGNKTTALNDRDEINKEVQFPSCWENSSQPAATAKPTWEFHSRCGCLCSSWEPELELPGLYVTQLSALWDPGAVRRQCTHLLSQEKDLRRNSNILLHVPTSLPTPLPIISRRNRPENWSRSDRPSGHCRLSCITPTHVSQLQSLETSDYPFRFIWCRGPDFLGATWLRRLLFRRCGMSTAAGDRCLFLLLLKIILQVLSDQ